MPRTLGRRTLLKAVATAVLWPTTSMAQLLEKKSSCRPVHWDCRLKDQGDQLFQVIREFDGEGGRRILAVHTHTLAATLHDFEEALPVEAVDFQNSRYGRCLASAAAPPAPLVNGGIRRANHPVAGFFLTIDLCPSPQPMDRRLFEGLLRSGLPRPMAIALGVSGHWFKHHRGEVGWLLEQEAAGQFSITWMNHSYSHFYQAGLPHGVNFMLRPGTNIEFEILELEWSLIKAGLVPSVFFRFPGLVANPQLLQKVAALGLIAVGSEAWLAKGEAIREGGVVLVHGNGNEPWGVDLLLKYLRKSQDRLNLLPLQEVCV